MPTATYTVCNTGFAKKESTPMLLTALALLGANIKTDVIDRETKSVTFEPTLVSAAIAEAQVEEVIRARLSGTK